MNLPDLRNFDLQGKRVLLRVDFDVPLVRREDKRVRGLEGWAVGDDTRIQNALPTINYLLEKKAKIIILSHLGRPEGKMIYDFSLEPVVEQFQEFYRSKVKYQDELIFLENLRFNKGEEENQPSFVKRLASMGDFYVNDAFAVSHRNHASVVGLPQLLPHAAGLSLLKEVETLSKVREEPQRPVVVILGGAKEDKLEAIPGLLKIADQILIGGRLPHVISNFQFLPCRQAGPISNSSKIVVGELNEEGKDLTLESVQEFADIIRAASTIVWAGPMGLYENEKWAMATKEVGKAVVASKALTIIGGGDTEAALTKFGLVHKIKFVSSGGGAMLDFLASGDLPGLKALRE